MNEELLTLIGVQSERDFDSILYIKEVKKIIFDCLQLGPMYNPLYDVLVCTNSLIGDDFNTQIV